ncbi:unnamed protein product [Ceutorhynchus assimilis]|uniref:Ubiquinone biosynthesis O-methyltransferase, mitochondrial n=1 Tax=Ceutorhynchus assimilis TaxID=467358 RepID=A0A9N9MP53_9CUCU|nr:unnamed protein product [Ceutorhynchus assimilis]
MRNLLTRITSLPSAVQIRLVSSVTTVDAKEIEFFQQTSDWWDKSGSMRPLHSMNKLRIPLIRDGLINQGTALKENLETATPLKGLSVLDIGCGGGILSEPLARLGAQVTGIDANPNIIEVAKKHAESNHLAINYLYTSIEDFCKDNQEKYHAIAASEILEHVTEKEAFIRACVTCLKPSGSIFITTLNKTMFTNILGIYVAENVLKLVPRGTHQFEKCIKTHHLQRLLEDNNIQTKLIHGLFYNICTNNWSWCSDQSINYCIHAIKC